MGADIHWVIEKKFEKGWAPVLTDYSPFIPYQIRNSVHIFHTGSRNYAFFAALAGVRGSGPKPNGLPDDISDAGEIVATQWETDGHSHGWLPLRQFIEAYIKTDNSMTVIATEQALNGKDPVIEFFEDTWVDKEDIDSHRVIFWFDN